MKRLRILGLSLLALLALGAIAANVALGEEGILEPQTFKIKGGTHEIENLNKEKIQCTSLEGTGTPLPIGEKDRDTHSTGTLDCNGCKSLGLACNTLGDPSGTILIAVLYLLCLVNAEKLVWGMLIAPIELPVHIEVPSLKALLLIKGAAIGLLLTKLKGVNLEGDPEGKEFAVVFNEADTTPRLKCSLRELGEWTATYETAIDTKPDIDARLLGEFDLTFAAQVKIMDA